MLALSAALFLASVAAPHLDWRTIHTRCCDVHYPHDLEREARRVGTIADESVDNASAFLESAPQERVQIVIHDVTDSPNGFTNVVPYDSVELRAITPEGDSELGATDEYLRLLVQHEILHVVHLDTIHGVPAVVNVVVGKVWPPNIIQPRFIAPPKARSGCRAVRGCARWRCDRCVRTVRSRRPPGRKQPCCATAPGPAWPGPARVPSPCVVQE